MKKIFYILLLVLSSGSLLAGGGGTEVPCSSASPFCTALAYDFPNETSTVAPSGPSYGCLGSQPNPVWYYMEVDQSGTFQISLSQTTGPNNTGSGLDVDFALWGPFSSLSTGCTSVNGGANPIQCSFDIAPTETIGIGLPGGTGSGASTPPAAVAGQVYILLITNYDGSSGYINFSQTGGTGVADCSIVTPCNIDNFTVNLNPCQSATNTFSINGSVTFTSAPSSGQLIVQDCNGNQQTFNAPFTSPINYSISGIAANGAACNVTATFTADPTCTSTINYTNQAPCTASCFITYMSTNISACNPVDNTFSVSGELQFDDPPTTGQLIFEDCNGNLQTFNAPFTSPTFYNLSGLNSDGTLNCFIEAYFTADPACTMTSLLYDNPDNCTCSADAGTYSQNTVGNTNSAGPLAYNLCYGDELNITANGDYDAPDDYTGSIAATYDPGVWLMIYDCPPTVGVPGDINTDPCLLGVASTANQAWTILNDLGDGSTYYFVPVTMYSMVDGIYAISINSGVWCYDLGPTYTVNFLEDITTNITPDCVNGTVAVSVSGGLPAFNGSQFTGSNLLPATANFVTQNANNGGNIVIGGLINGDNYSFDITDASGCPVSISGTFTGLEDPSFTYPDNAYCQDEPNPSPMITGTVGGTFTSSPAGLSINSASGLINLAASTAGTYTITYTTPSAACGDQATFDLTVNQLPTVDGNDPIICVGQSVTLNGTGADSYVWSGGVSNGISFVPAASGSFTVTGTITATGCSNTGSSNVTVNPGTPVDAGIDQEVCEGEQVTLTASGSLNYVWSPLVTQGVPFTPTVGTTTYTVTATDVNGCQATDQVDVLVNPLPVVDAGSDFIICEGESAVLTATGAQTYQWNNGVLNGVNFFPTSTSTYTVTGTDANGCEDTDMVTITVGAIPNPVFVADLTSGCAPLTVTLTNTTPGSFSNCVWTINNGTTVTGCGSVNVTFPSEGLFDVTLTLTTSNGCVGSTTYNDYIYVEAEPFADFTPSTFETTISNTNVQFTNNSLGATSYSWNFGDSSPNSTSVNPMHTYPDHPGTYVIELIAYSALGCPDTTYRTIVINDELIFYVPNTFTPDDDDFNEYFQPVFTSGFDPFDFSLYIYNRWGEIIWESHDTNVGWDGTYGVDRSDLVQDGTYTWKIEFKTTMSDERKLYIGHVNVLK